MEIYLANRIADGALDYSYVISKRPEFKSAIDDELIRLGKQDLIVEV